MQPKKSLIRRLLEDLTVNHTQLWIAEQANIAQSAISRILAGKTVDPSASKLVAIQALHTKHCGKPKKPKPKRAKKE